MIRRAKRTEKRSRPHRRHPKARPSLFFLHKIHIAMSIISPFRTKVLSFLYPSPHSNTAVPLPFLDISSYGGVRHKLPTHASSSVVNHFIIMISVNYMKNKKKTVFLCSRLYSSPSCRAYVCRHTPHGTYLVLHVYPWSRCRLV